MAISTIGASGLNSAVSQIGKNLVTNGGANVSQRGTQTGQYNAYTAVDLRLLKTVVEEEDTLIL